MSEPEPELVTAEELKDAHVGASSPLGLLRGKRAELDANLFYDIEVPRWSEILGRAVWVRYKPGQLGLLNAALERRKENHDKAVRAGKQGDPEWVAKANADMLVDSCVGVYDLAIGEEPPTGELPPNLPTFSEYALSESLDMPDDPCPRNAVGTALRLYGTPADLMLAASQLVNWSGQASKEADRSFLPQ
jgi:hypothetical protein